MKTSYEHIYFEQNEVNVWHCRNNKNDKILGDTRINLRWREHIFRPRTDAIFSASRLDDIAHFLKQLNDRNGDEKNV